MGHGAKGKSVFDEGQPYIIDEGTGCWLWIRSTNPKGYGTLHIDGKHVYAHRFMYTKYKGPIPEGLDLDHTCVVTGCVNPDHLEPVTRSENIRRGFERGNVIPPWLKKRNEAAALLANR